MSAAEVVAYAQADSCIFLSAKQFVDVFEPIVASVTAVFAHPYASERQVQVVRNNQKIL